MTATDDGSIATTDLGFMALGAVFATPRLG